MKFNSEKDYYLFFSDDGKGYAKTHYCLTVRASILILLTITQRYTIWRKVKLMDELVQQLDVSTFFNH